MEASKPRVYGCRGAWNRCCATACSTTRPAYITTTREHSSAITPRSWVMNRMAMPVACCNSRRSSRICAWMVTSNAVVGSSAMSTSGRQAKAMAIITRWRMPPESSCGYSSSRRSGAGMPTCSSRPRARRAASAAERPLWCKANTSVICRPMRCTGFSAVIGS